MTNTNERFDEQIKPYLMARLQGLDKPKTWDIDRVKTFISQEKNLLLDQAIEEGKKMKKRCNKAECAKNELGGCDPMDMVGQYISKLKELKE